MELFKDYAYYYNAFYKDKDYASEAKDVDFLLKKYGEDINRIIVFGCGTGNHDKELARLGYHIHGIDISSNMIEVASSKARENGLGIEYEVADVRNYKSCKRYDAVLSLFHVMSYQNSNKDIKAAFSSARSVLKTGGVFLLDSWYGPGVLTEPPEVRIKEVEDDTYRLVRLCRPHMNEETDTVDVNYEILLINKKTKVVSNIEETHHMRYFFRPEIDEYLRMTGFELLETLDCKTLGRTNLKSWTVYYIARAV